MSSKKQFDYIEDKIKQAAENSVPPFDEKAWQAMQAKLDGDDKKRRPLLWWFILPLLIGFIWGGYQLLKPSSATQVNDVKTTINKKEKDTEGNLADSKSKEAVALIENKTAIIIADEKSKHNDSFRKNNTGNSNVAVDVYGGEISGTGNDKDLFRRSKNKKIKGKTKGRLTTQVSGGVSDEEIESTPKNINEKSNIEQEVDIKNSDVVTTNDKSLNEKKSVVNEVKEIAKKQEDKKATETEKKTTDGEKKAGKEKSKGTKKGFYVLATGGADAGSTKFLSFKNSTTEPKYGVGIGYQFAKKWSVQTGFYVTNKKYVASPADYTIKPGSPMAPMGAYPLDKINASCKVYEIPLVVRFEFLSKPSFSMYATAGASSYILKKESYDCFYTYYDNVYENNWQYKGNKHLFSTAVFSVGIEKNMSSKFSIIAEPSLSVPLSGVGDGKMKLYSASLQAGIKYYFFKRK